jgi:hypothetical protein
MVAGSANHETGHEKRIVATRARAGRGKSPWTCALEAGLATALFVMYPLRAEVVAKASCQPYLPCALFSMLAVLAYLCAFERGPCPGPG